jgi:hypothetical protein
MGKGRDDGGPGHALHPALAQVRAYWDARRGTAPVPPHAGIDPRGIERALAQVFVGERVAPGQLRLRVAGSHLAGIAGTDPRGLPLSVFFEPAARGALAAAVMRAFGGPGPVALRLSTPWSVLAPPMRGDLLLLPLRGESGEVDRMLGALATEGRIGTAPRRFLIEDAGAAAELAEPARAFTGRPRLRLVHSRE